jgi:hypothetical protein
MTRNSRPDRLRLDQLQLHQQRNAREGAGRSPIVFAAGRSEKPYRHAIRVNLCQVQKFNILCKLGYENRAKYVAHLLGSFEVGPDDSTTVEPDDEPGPSDD